MARIEWILRPTRPGTYTENFVIQLYGVDGSPLDSHTLLLSVDEAGAQVSVTGDQAVTLTTALGSAQLEAPQKAFSGAAGRIGPLGQQNIDLHLMPVCSAAMEAGFVRIGEALYVVAAFHSGTVQPASITGSPPILTLHWDEAALPAFVPAADLRIFMAENDRQWTPLNSSVNINARTVHAAIPRAGSFTIGWLDPSPPAAIKGLRTTGDGNRVVLRWSRAAEADVVGYQLLAREQPGTQVVAAYAISTPFTIDFSPAQHAKGLTRYYTVRALDAAGNFGPESDPIAVKQPGEGGDDTVVLSIRLQDGTVVFSWPAETKGFLLESCSRLPADNWSVFPVNPVVVEGRCTVSSPVPARAQFFRLKKP